MDKTFCVICKIFHAPNEGCPVYVPMLTAVPQCPSCAALRARIEGLEKVLLFYSNEDNWENDVVDIGVGNMAIPHSSEAARDEGKVARAALAAKEG